MTRHQEWTPPREKEETLVGGRRQAEVGTEPGRGEGRSVGTSKQPGAEQAMRLPWLDQDIAQNLKKVLGHA